VRNALPRSPQLLAREVDAGEAATRGEKPGRRDAGTDAELEDVGLGRQQVEERFDAFELRRSSDLALPLREASAIAS
jgi:hypothetical protein